MPIPDPAQAWELTIQQLAHGMPTNRFEEFVVTSRCLDFNHGVMTVAVVSPYACGWLEDRVKTLAQQHLAGCLNQQVTVNFVVDDSSPSDQPEAEGQKSSNGSLVIEAADSTEYQAEVRPDRVVVIDGYFLRMLEQGEIEPKGLSLYLGFRQAVYNEWSAKKQVKTLAKNIPHYEVMSFAMMGRASYFREIKGQDELCGGLVERLQGELDFGIASRQEANANRYRVSMFPKLTRRDLTALEALIDDVVDHNPMKTEALPAITRFLNQLATEGNPAEYLANAAGKPLTKQRSLSGVIRNLVGWEEDLPHELMAAAERVTDSILSAFGKIVVTHYFLQVVAPTLKLTHPQVWAIIALRDRCWFDHESKSQAPFALVPGGVETLASWVGVTAEAVRLWLPTKEFSAFVQLADMEKLAREQGWNRQDAIFLVSHQEPMLGKVRLDSPKSETRSDEKCDSVLRKVRLDLAKSETRLNNLNIAFKSFKRAFKSTTGNFENSAENPVVADWDLAALFRQNAVSAKSQRRMLEAGISPEAFVSWLLYSYTPAGRGLNDPVGVAINNVLGAHVGAGGACDALATLGPQILTELLRNSLRGALVTNPHFVGNLSWLPAAKKQELLVRLGSTPVETPERHPSRPDQGPADAEAQRRALALALERRKRG